MNQTKFTPGKWRISYDTKLPDGTETESIISEGTFPFFIAHCEGPQRKANARLISKAPELVKALQDLLESYSAYVDVDQVTNADIVHPVNQARAVLNEIAA